MKSHKLVINAYLKVYLVVLQFLLAVIGKFGNGCSLSIICKFMNQHDVHRIGMNIVFFPLEKIAFQ